ncbi:MAG: FAD:protein FMN transferase [Flavobacteriales bacterium]|nr:FAD:protein FMN transferase [Bacteroidota bacterium]MCB9241892.1 FAD:protein FMN transferase [Flavobacteriales bacterium]
MIQPHLKIPLLIIGLCISWSVSALNTAKKTGVLMGSYFEVVAVANNDSIAQSATQKAWDEISRIEKLISSWDTNSETHAINQNAGIQPVKVSTELFQLIKRSIKISQLTGGGFDISYAALDKLWNFRDQNLKIPEKAAIDAAVSHVGFGKILLDNGQQTVFLLEKGMKIGFGGIGKGFAANQARKLMMEMGIENGLVNAGGDLIAWGHKADGSKWRIGLADPNTKGKVFSYLSVSNGAVVTSGDYERYVMIDGKRYAHILDPRTGYPVTGLKSVTILCPDAEIADALATSVFVLGREKGLTLVNQLNDVEAVLVTDQNEILTSANVNLEK